MGLIFILSNQSYSMDTIAREALIVDMQTGTSLMEKNPDAPMPPASMSKLMTLYILFEQLQNGSLKLDDTFKVSEKAWRLGGFKSGSSTMGLNPGERVRIEDLIRGIIVQSGNDACIVVAEGLAGSEELFAEQMNTKAKLLGLKNSTFKNSTGWPHPGHRMTPRDLVTLTMRTISDFPKYYHYYKETEFTHNRIKQFNRNPLIFTDPTVDGLKTGYTQEAGYGLTASALRGGRRLIIVVNGLTSKKDRRKEPERLFDWGFREFNNYELFKAGEIIDEADVWLGTESKVPFVINDNLTLTLKRKLKANMKVTLKYKSPIPAPISKGDKIGVLEVKIPYQETIKMDVIAGQSVKQLGFLGRLVALFTSVIWGVSG